MPTVGRVIKIVAMRIPPRKISTPAESFHVTALNAVTFGMMPFSMSSDGVAGVSGWDEVPLVLFTLSWYRSQVNAQWFLGKQKMNLFVHFLFIVSLCR